MNIYEVFTKIDKKVDEIRIETFLEYGKHEVTVIFYYEVINRVVFFYMPIDLYEICKNSYKDDVYKIIYHLPVEPSDIIEAESVPVCPF
jgi:hypothetical protein